ncbi:MAG: DUF11 domain-containing protein [Burkholderiales bacterium]|nr:DUF11 domain-containing protein [Burkholderiales bacterium]
MATLLAAASTSALADLGASVTLVTGDPTSIYPGQVTRLQITLSNSDPGNSLINVGFANSLPVTTAPNGLKVAGPVSYVCTDPASGPVATTGTLTATVNTRNIALAGATIPAASGGTDGICVIEIPVTAGTSSGAQATYVYSIASGAVTGNPSSAPGATLANSGTVQQSIPVNALSRPTISKSALNSPPLTLGGASRQLTVTLSNTNPVPISGFSIEDVFPTAGTPAAPIIVLANPPLGASTCTSGPAPVVTGAAGAGSFAATGTIPANGSCTLRVNVVAAQTAGDYQVSANNTINGTSQFSNDLGITAANASAAVSVRSPLRVSKTVNSGSLASGENGSFTVTLFNDGADPLTNVAFNDNPIDGSGAAGYGLKLNGAPTTSCAPATVTAIGDTGVSLSGATIPAAGSCTVTIPFTGTVQQANTARSYTNTLAQGAVTVGSPVNTAIVSQAASATTTVYQSLFVRKESSPTTAAPGSPVRYRVTVENWTPGALANVRVTDSFTQGQTFLTGTIGGQNFTPTVTPTGACVGVTTASTTGATSPQFVIASVPGRPDVNTPGTCTIEFWAMIPPTAAPGSTFGNTIAAGGVCYGVAPAEVCNTNNTPATTGSVGAVLSLAKSFSPAGPLPEGTVSRVTLTLNNRSAQPLTGVTLGDNLPLSGINQMRVANPANAATTCTGAPVITAVPGETSVSMNGATVPARADGGLGALGTCTMVVDVVAGAGTYPNIGTASGTATRSDGTSEGLPAVNSPQATLVYNSVISATKAFAPSSITSGGRSTVTIRLVNSGAVALSGVAVNDPLPAGMVLADPPSAYTTCAGSTAITAAAGASSALLSGANVAGNGSCEFIFDVEATGSANWVNTIPAGNITAAGGITNQTPVSATLTYNPPSGLTVTKTSNPSTLTFPGQTSRLTITLTAGTQSVTGLAVTDYFTADGTAGAAPNGMAIAPTPSAATTCPGGVVTAAAGGTQVGLSIATLAAGTSCTLSVNVTSTAVGGITNFIPSGAVTTYQGLSNAGPATTSLTTQSNIGVTKQFTPNVVKPGERSRLRITFYNPTAQPLSGIATTDNLPAGVTVPAGPDPVTTCTGGSVTSPTASSVSISGATLPAASGGVLTSCYAEIDVVVAAQGDYVNTIPIGGVTAFSGGNTVTNSQPTSDTLRAKSPVVIAKAIQNLTLDAAPVAPFTAGTATRAPGQAGVLAIRLTNPNAVPLTAVGFTDTLPSGLVVAATPGVSNTCAGTVTADPSGTLVRLAGATLAANASCVVNVNVLSNISGTYTNTIPAGGVTTFEGVTNDEPTRARVIVSVPPGVTKQFVPAVIPPGGTSRLTIFIANENASALTLTSALTDTLPTVPGQVRVATPPNVVNSCLGPGGVAAPAGATSVVLSSNSTVPAGGCSIAVDVTASSSGTHNNTIPAGALQTNLGVNPQPANAPLVVSTLGYVSGRVFQDNNTVPNGTYESGTDTPLAGVTIELRAGASCAAPLYAATGFTNPVLTDALGNYLFSSLPAGPYSLCQPTQPAGTANGITTAGTPQGGGTIGTATGVATVPSAITNLVLADLGGGAVSGSTGNNFAEVVLSSISGTAFIDMNNNGVQNGADTPLAGVTIELLDAGGGVIATTTTAADGSYSFTGLQPGTYSVRQPTQPPGTSSGLTVPGTINGTPVGTATTPAVTASRISNIVLPPNAQSVQNNFAELPNTRTVSGAVFLDYDNNGLLDGPSDHGLGGQVINLTGTDVNGGTVTRTTTTAADGSYSFTGLPPGTYAVTQPAQPTGTTNGITTPGSAGGTATGPATAPSAIANIDLTSTPVSGGNNFAEVPNAAPDLAISKTHAPSAFAAGGNVGYYTITPRNIGPVATSGTITITDTLPAGITVAEPATGTGWACVGAVGASVVTCTGTTPIAANAAGAPITLRVSVAPAAVGQVLVNRVRVDGGGEPAGFDGNNTAEDPVAVTAGAALSGHVWRDTNHDRIRDPGEPLVEGWTVELLNGGVVVATTTTDAGGAYRFEELAPGSGYTVRFREPGTGRLYGRPVPNERGVAYTSGVTNASANPAGADNTRGVLDGLTLLAGDNVVEQSLPLDPAGVVYDAITRAPVSGATVTISGPAGFTAANVIGGQLSQVTGATGAYQFLLLPGAPVGTYTLTVTEPPGYAPGVSTLIPPCTATLNVLPAPPDPALVQNANQAPDAAAPLHDPATCAATSAGLGAGAGSTQYYLSFELNPAFPGGSANLVNNHIPLDPMGATGFSITKTGDKRVVEVGDTVLYTITVRRTQGAPIPQITVHDRLPAGFTLVPGTVRVNGAAAPNPSGGVGPVLGFTIGGLPVGGSATLTYRVRVGVGSQQGTGLNIAKAYGCAVPAGCLDANQNPVPASIASNEARFQVKVTGGVFTTEACVVGKIFVDCNGNHIQDAEEVGIPGVRLYFQSGDWLVSDSEGKYSQCGLTPNSHVLKVDPRTLPKGSRLVTSSNRNLGDGNSLFLDIKNGELHRADFIEGSCANPVMEQVKARRAQGEVRSVQTERKGGPALRFESRPLTAPRQATDSANQPIVQPRAGDARAR